MEWSEVISEAMEGRIKSIFTALPARVERFDAARETVDALPMIDLPEIDDEGLRRSTRLPLIQNVPVAFPRGGGYAMSFPIAQGDTVLLVFSMMNVGEWFETGNRGDPGDVTLHGLSGAVAYPGLFPATRPSPAAASGVFTITGQEFRFGAVSGTQPLARADRVEDAIEGLRDGIAAALLTALPTESATIGALPVGSTGSNRVRGV